MRLLEDPALIQTEIDRRREAAQKADPLRKREEELRREQARMEKSGERLVTAYQEGLLTLPQLRQRMPALQKQTQAVESELYSLKMAAADETKYLRLAESLAGFRSRLRLRAETLDVAVRQQILRLLVKEVLVAGDTITLRHSIPIPQSGPGSNGSPAPPSAVTGSTPGPGYLLRTGSHLSTAGKSVSALCVRRVDAEQVSACAVRTVCRRCDRALPDGSGGAGGAGSDSRAHGGMPAGASSGEDEDCLLQG